MRKLSELEQEVGPEAATAIYDILSRIYDLVSPSDDMNLMITYRDMLETISKDVLKK